MKSKINQHAIHNQPNKKSKAPNATQVSNRHNINSIYSQANVTQSQQQTQQ